MTHDTETELSDDQLAHAVGGKGYTGVLTLTSDATIGVDSGSTLTVGSKSSAYGGTTQVQAGVLLVNQAR